MALKDLFKKLKKKNTKILSDDNFCRSDIIFHGEDYLLLLLSYTDNYNQDMVEFLDAESNMDCCVTRHKIKLSSYDETNKDGEVISHNRNYMLFAITDIADFMTIYYCIESVSNTILKTITDDIINNYNIHDIVDVQKLVENGIITINNDPNLDYDVLVCDNGEYLDPKIVRSKVPNVFTGLDILQFIRLNTYFGSTYFDIDIIGDFPATEEAFRQSEYYNICKELFKHPSRDKIHMLLTTPLYMLPDEDDSLPGDLDDESLDSIFREKYERFSAVADDSTFYEDIDEILSEDEESDNMREEDKIE